MTKLTLKAAMINAGKTQESLAEELGVSRKTIWNVLNGKGKVKPVFLMGFAYACNVKLDDLCVENTTKA